jgi:hypothetical protein
LLILIGVVCAVLLLLNYIVKTALKRERPGIVDALLTIVTVMMFVLAVTLEQGVETPDPQVPQIALVMGGVLALAGVFMFVLERMHGVKRIGSRGVLALGAGIMTALSTFTIPATSEALAFPTSTPIQVAQLVAAPTRALLTALPTSTPLPAVSPTATLTITPSATVMPTATRITFSNATPLPTATLVTPCLAVTEFNLRLREVPNTDGETLAVIPFSTTIALYGRDEDSAWWYVLYENNFGWVDGEFIERTANCDDLPVQPQ